MVQRLDLSVLQPIAHLAARNVMLVKEINGFRLRYIVLGVYGNLFSCQVVVFIPRIWICCIASPRGVCI
ncbi:hypothetical protein EJB05_27897 [Eragrostis curvula]|uniref:Uncharacterized protein n=1 Tax=Eragrostis curvula TaxID=38414 RepID=A0A5J9UNQ3_9POAL|nr:hypothetical protein EJB05_27897 [Eragrostis curvula]